MRVPMIRPLVGGIYFRRKVSIPLSEGIQMEKGSHIWFKWGFYLQQWMWVGVGNWYNLYENDNHDVNLGRESCFLYGF